VAGFVKEQHMTMVISGSDGVTFPDSTNQFSGGAFSFKNRVINGDMRIDQRNAGASVTPTNTEYLVDRFSATLTQASKFTVQQSSTAPAGFVNSLLVTSSSAYSVVTSDIFAIRQRIEGTNLADLGWGTANAKTVTVSFWVRSSLTGTFGGSLNNAGTRSYPFTYTISSANTWEYKTVTIPGDTSGTWLTTTGIGLQVSFALGGGDDWSGTAGAWASANDVTATGATSVVGTNGATFYITGVQLEVGSVATPFERRPYGTELNLCQRYLPEPIVNGTTIMGTALSNTSSYARLTFTIPVRTPPTGISVSAANHFSVYSFNNTTSGAATSVAFASGDSIGGWVQITTTAGSPTLAAGHTTQFYGSNASARLLFTGCEL
jgi:hypothetical protein